MIGLAEFMNVPGVLNKDPDCLDKLAAFQLAGGFVAVRDGQVIAELALPIAGLMSGSDLAALVPLIDEFTSPFLGFCTDDRNPLDIHEEGHIDHMVRRAIALGAPAAAVYRTASWSAARGFGLRDRGLVAPGYLADILLLDDLASCAVHLVLRRGRPVTEQTFDDRVLPPPPAGNSVRLGGVTARTFAVPARGPSTPVIGIIPGKILTERLQADLPFRGGERHADPTRDLLKVCVLERHGRNGNVGRGFVKGFGLKRGALASSVGHDSHNICVLGASDEDMALAVNRVIGRGGPLADRTRGQP